MKRINCSLFCLVLINSGVIAQDTWKMIPGRISSSFSEQVNPSEALPEYPRPQMVRPNWSNLNGLWSYTILPKSDTMIPASTQGEILVPFAVESALSGVGKTVGKDSVLWYKKSIRLSASSNKSVLLHFGAVDWLCTVYVNGRQVGTHQGGYDPFFFDISAALKKGNTQDIAVRVWDPSDDGPQPRGKQVKKPESIWYTPVTGIWQTVWLETVPKTYLISTKQTPDTDQELIAISAKVQNPQPGDELLVSAWDGGTKIAESRIAPDASGTISIPNAKKWSPQSPFLYDLKYTLLRKNKTIDEVRTYTAMRKISMQADVNGVQRLLLNNEFLFQYGPLDQGWWPDGLYTAPTDEALKFDIIKTKEMGFNMIRKHVKVEPARWYYHCDQLGMLVWQDMPSGDMGNRWDMRPGIYGRATDKQRTTESEAVFKQEWKEIMNDLHNFPSIVIWVPFNEAWGQFKTREITEWTMLQDPSRLVNSASGGNFEPVGHIMDLHNYPEPAMPLADLFGSRQVIVLGEFGGLGLPLESHTWQDRNNWGYQSFKSREELTEKYAEFIERIPELISKGLSAAVYTQTTDVEIETNGLMSYDRKEIKIPVERLKQLHEQLYNKTLVVFNLK